MAEKILLFKIEITVIKKNIIIIYKQMYRIISDIVNLGKNYDSSLFENTSLDSLIGGNIQQPQVVVYEDTTSRNIILCCMCCYICYWYLYYIQFLLPK
jgi:hypothetical protein